MNEIIIPVVTGAIGVFATWFSMRHSWSQTLKKEQLAAARRIVTQVTKAQQAIANQVERRCMEDEPADYDEIDEAKEALLKAAAASRLVLGDDIYRRIGRVVEAIDRDADCLSDDAWRWARFTWEAMEALRPALEHLVGLRFPAPVADPFKIVSNRLIPYERLGARRTFTPESTAATAVAAGGEEVELARTASPVARERVQ